MLNVFSYENYRQYLKDHLDAQGKGAKIRMAAVIDCQPGYVSQILSGIADLSAEQAEKFTSFSGWDHASTRYFLLLVAFERAGTKSLAAHYRQEIERMRTDGLMLKNQLKATKALSVEDQAVFYSSWHYGAVHVAVSIPGCETEEGLAAHFNLPLKKVNEIVQFLLRLNLVKKADSGKLSIGSSHVYLGSDSPIISKHHTNWRMQAISSLDRLSESHLHYSSVISISRSDVERVRQLMAEAIQQIRAIVRESKDETCYSYLLDLFEVGGKI